jgi:methionine--tRNA ligase beta chain
LRELDCPLHPEDPAAGSRKVPFTRTLYVEQDDWRDEAVKEWYRLAPGQEVRLRYACLVRCREAVRDASGKVVELRCTMDPDSWGGTSPDGRTVKGTLHWVSAEKSVPLEARLYDRLFKVENPGMTENVSFLDEINPESLVTAQGRGEPHLATVKAGDRVQFERLAYFRVDEDTRPGKPVFNRTVALKDTWAKIEKKLDTKPAPKAAPKPPKEAKAPKGPAPKPQPAAEVAIEDFQKLDFRVGVVRVAELVKDADKLLRLEIDLGEGRNRQVFSGIRSAYPDPAVLVGKRVMVIANLKPRQMKFGLSVGLVLVGGDGGTLKVCTFDEGVKRGDRVT